MNKVINFIGHDFYICENKEADINIIMYYDDDENGFGYNYFDYIYDCSITEDEIKNYIEDTFRICEHCGRIFSSNVGHYVVGGKTGTVYCSQCANNKIYDSELYEEM